jgi:hypothetical protein
MSKQVMPKSDETGPIVAKKCNDDVESGSQKSETKTNNLGQVRPQVRNTESSCASDRDDKMLPRAVTSEAKRDGPEALKPKSGGMAPM